MEDLPHVQIQEKAEKGCSWRQFSEKVRKVFSKVRSPLVLSQNPVCNMEPGVSVGIRSFPVCGLFIFKAGRRPK